MAKSNNKQRKIVTNHSFRGLREVLLNPAIGGSPGTNSYIAVASSSAGTTTSVAFVLCPLGLTSTKLGASSYTRGDLGNVYGPPLRGLYNRAVDFQWYRVTRAKFVFVGSVASNAIGMINLAAYSDPFDATNSPSTAVTSSSSTRSFDLANASAKELSVPVPVDSSWKKCSSVLTIPGNIFPFVGQDAGSLAVVNTVGDLTFGCVSASWSTSLTSGEIGRFFLDYDVEFKGPIDASINA